MRKRTLRRKLSFALQAFVFLSFALAEKVEARAVAATLLSLSREANLRIGQAARTAARK